MRAQDQTPDQDHRPRSPAPTVRTSAPAVPGAPLSQRAMLALQRTLGNAVAARLVTARRQAHDEAGTHGQHGARSAVTDVLRTTGAPLDTTLRQEMEDRLGADFSDVRVHTGATADLAAGSVGAEAFTSGSHVVFRSGAYNPVSAAGKHVLAHELTHVQQQRRGPVPGTNHDGVSVSDPSDAYERAAEANAHQVMRAPVRRAQNEPETPGAGGPLAVQRNAGIELEDTNWTATAEGGRPIAKFTPLAHGELFQLQAEFAGDDRFGLEMVTVKGGVRDEEWDAMCAGMQNLANRLDTLGRKKVKFSTALLPGGEAGYQLTPSRRGIFDPHLQMTVGVPLAALPRLFEKLDELEVITNMQGYKREDETAKVRTAVSQNLNMEPSEDLVGFITLLKSYVRAGKNPLRNTFLKAVFKVMARTDFASMFALLPESEKDVIANNLDGWVATVVADETAGDRLLNSWYYDSQDEEQPPYEIVTTRRQWLSDMADPDTRRDRLQSGFRQANGDVDRERVADVREYDGPRPALNEQKKPGEFKSIKIPDDTQAVEQLVGRLEDIYQGLGALGRKTDLIQYQNRDEQPDGAPPTEAVILEIRDPGKPGVGFAGKIRRATNIHVAVREAIELTGGKYENVATNELRETADDQRNEAARGNTRFRQLRAKAAWWLRRGSAPLVKASASLRGGSRR